MRAPLVACRKLVLDYNHSPHRISAGGSLLFMKCVFLTLTGLVSARRRGEAPSAIDLFHNNFSPSG